MKRVIAIFLAATASLYALIWLVWSYAELAFQNPLAWTAGQRLVVLFVSVVVALSAMPALLITQKGE